MLVFDDGSVLIEPTNNALAKALGLKTKDAHSFHDLTVAGGGPAGLTAALYAAREGISTLVIERGAIGGQAGITERLDNFPGFPEGVSGAEFADRLRRQAERFGVEILQAQEVTAVKPGDEYQVVVTGDGSEYSAKVLLLALGSTYRRLGIPGENDFIGAGVHFCATCDGPFYRDKEVLVIGGGNSAGEESLFLTRFAAKVAIATRGPALTASQFVVQKIAENPAIELLTGARPVAFEGGDRLASVVLEDVATGERRTLHPAGVFVFAGLTPNTAVLEGVVELDPRGFIVADGALQTNLPGIFAAGDCRAGSTKQAASAAGEGAAAALAIRRYLEPANRNVVEMTQTVEPPETT